ncbi:RNA-splicing factor [Malassezia furfur]|uniref:RNA-splicing factor n=1 Tax=Malassezia furfur TaxID=55194 RepID=A0ABY8EMG3_MALFU|nr:RNA-splicing factor [Malassezia furfur]
MYNGIGLQTARGSGTNGYVQRNLSSIRPRDAPRAQPQEKARIFEPDQRILDHERKRKIEIQCIELQDELEEQGLPDDEIEARVDALRARLRERQDAVCPSHQETKSLRPSDTHALGAAKKLEREKMERALRIRPDYVEGEAFSPEIQERRKMERKEERARLHEEAQARWEQRRTERAERDVRVDRQPDIDDPRVSRPPRDARDRGWDSPRDHGWPARRSPSPGAASRTPSPPHTAAPPPPGPPPRRPDASREGPV